jgi:hypothetical protein
MIGTYELDRSGDTARIRILGSTTWLTVVVEEPIDIRLISEWRVKKGTISRKEKDHTTQGFCEGADERGWGCALMSKQKID